MILASCVGLIIMRWVEAAYNSGYLKLSACVTVHSGQSF